MKISSLLIKNFKTIKELNIDSIESAFIIVGKNSTGKTTILKAILAVAGQYEVKQTDFNDPNRNIEIAINLEITNADIIELHSKGKISKYKNFDMLYKEFYEVLPTFVRGGKMPDAYDPEDPAEGIEEMFPSEAEQDASDFGGLLSFSYVVDTEMNVRFSDGINKNNLNLKKIFPKVYFFDVTRDVREIQDSIFMVQTKSVLKRVRDTVCMYDESRPCNRCFRCIKDISQKAPDELSILETTKLLEFKLMQLNMDECVSRLNSYYIRNSGRQQDIEFTVKLNTKDLFIMDTLVTNRDHYGADSVDTLSAGAKSIYILSLRT